MHCRAAVKATRCSNKLKTVNAELPISIKTMQVPKSIQVAWTVASVLSLSLISNVVADHHGEQVEDGFKSLFNGKDLTDWTGNPNLWSVIRS